MESAFNLGKNLMKKSTGWFFGGNQEPEEEPIKIDPGQSMHMRSQIVDSAIRKGLGVAKFDEKACLLHAIRSYDQLRPKMFSKKDYN